MNMKRVYSFMALALFVSAISSCQKDVFSERITGNEDEGYRAPVSVSMAPIDGDEAGTKSAMIPNVAELEKITDLNYYVFDTEGNFVSQTFYSGNIEDFYVKVPDYKKTYRVYFFTNVGKYEIPTTTKADDMGTAVHLDFGTYANYTSLIHSKGFPAALYIPEYSIYTTSDIHVKRLVQTLKLKVNTDGLSVSSLVINNIRIRQAARDIFPFTDSKLTVKFTEDLGDGDLGADFLSESDIETIASSGKDAEVFLYVLENMRGNLIPGNSSWKNKTPANINNPQEAALATYIDIEATVVTPTVTYNNVKYRAYLGNSPENFDVKRSTIFTLENSFTNDMIQEEEWRIEAEDPTITGELKFMKPKNSQDHSDFLESIYSGADGRIGQKYVNYIPGMIPGSEEAEDGYYLHDGFKQTLFIERSNKDIKFNLSMSQDKSVRPYLDYSLEEYDDTHYKLTIETTRIENLVGPVDEYGHQHLSNGDVTGVNYNSFTPRKVYPVKFSITSEDGFLTDTVTINYFYGKVGALFCYDEVTQYGRAGSRGHLAVVSGNPLDLVFSYSSSGRVGMYYDGENGEIEMKSSDGIDERFLKYIGSSNSQTNKYGNGNQTAPYRYLTIPTYDVGNWILVCGFLGVATFGLSWLPIIIRQVSASNGTLSGWFPSVSYVPYDTYLSSVNDFYTYKRGPNGQIVVDSKMLSNAIDRSSRYYRRNGNNYPSHYWGNYDETIVNWRNNSSLSDILDTYERDNIGTVYGREKNGNKLFHHKPFPFNLELHIDMLLGEWCVPNDEIDNPPVEWTTPLLAVSLQNGLSVDYRVLKSFGNSRYNDESSSLRRRVKLTNLLSNNDYWYFSQWFILDQTRMKQQITGSSDTYFINKQFGYDGGDQIYFKVRTEDVIPWDSFERPFADVIQREVAAIYESTAQIFNISKAEPFIRKYLRLPSCVSFKGKDGTYLFNPWQHPTLIIPASYARDNLGISVPSGKSSIEMRLCDYFKLPQTHFATYTLNHFVDYLGE